MNPRIPASILTLAFAACASPGGPSRGTEGRIDAAAPRTTIDLLVGLRQLDEDDWAPVDEQTAFGVQAAYEGDGAAVGFEVGLSRSSEDETMFVPGFGDFDFESEIVEASFGLHKSFAPSPTVRPYVGAGLAWAMVDAKGSVAGASADDDDGSPGFYAHGGVAYESGGGLRLGADLRTLIGTDVELFGASGDVDYVQLALFLGWRF
jgi:hypothetical protein